MAVPGKVLQTEAAGLRGYAGEVLGRPVLRDESRRQRHANQGPDGSGANALDRQRITGLRDDVLLLFAHRLIGGERSGNIQGMMGP